MEAAIFVVVIGAILALPTASTVELAAAGGHPERPADLGHLGDVQPADALHQERLRHRSEVVEAERTGPRHPVVDVQAHFGRDVTDRPGGGDSNDHMKVLYGCLAGQDEVGAALRARRLSPPDFSSGYHGSCSIEATARRSTEASGTGGGRRL